MRQIDWYIDTAVKKQGLSSPRALGPHLGLSVAAASNWRTRRAWPGDETMVRLADLCGVPREEALLELSVWRTAGTQAGIVYLRLLEAAGKSAAILLIALLVYAVAAPTAHAGTFAEQSSLLSAPKINYATNRPVAKNGPACGFATGFGCDFGFLGPGCRLI